MKTIITHPGGGHRDDFISCCLLLAAGIAARIIRREPTADELEDPNILVVDVGGQHNPELGNYDHHQLDKNAPPTCSLTLIMPLLGIAIETARSAWQWFSFSEWLDAKGPTQTAEAFKMTQQAFDACLSPIESSVLRWFSDQKDIGPGDRLYSLMISIGVEKLEYLHEIVERLSLLAEIAKLNKNPDGSYWLDIRAIAGKDNPALGTDLFLQKLGVDCPISVSNDTWGDERITLYRYNDDPRVDFSRLVGRENVYFAHANGFIAKVAADADVAEMISASFV